MPNPTRSRRVSQSLAEYSAKRAFDATPEPEPAVASDRKGPLLFVVQEHSARRLHFDFRIECDGILKSWAVPKGPTLDPTEKRLAVLTEDHPFDYGSFEGVIPPGQYGAGEVIVWDCGVYSPDADGRYAFEDRAEAERRVREEFAQGKLSVFLCGARLKGSFALVRTSDEKNWLMLKHRDRYARPGFEAVDEPQSVLSQKSVLDLKSDPGVVRLPAERLAPHGSAEALPRSVAPMLATARKSAFTHPDWLFEPKLDGYRVIAIGSPRGFKLHSRRGLDLGAAFPEIASELRENAVAPMVLDAELIALDGEGRPSFGALQLRAQLKGEEALAAAARTPCLLYCFDLLHFAGVDLRRSAFEDRHRYLEQCLLPSAHVRLMETAADGEALYRAALEAGFEGIVAKRRSSAYASGVRSPNWVKIKATQSEEFLIGGYSEGEGRRKSRFGALLLGSPEKGGKLRYVGRVGSGFDEATLATLHARFAGLERDRSPFVDPPADALRPTWLEPELVAEVKFAERTSDGRLRAPVFIRLRDDVKPAPARAQARDPDPIDPEAGGADVLAQLGERKDRLTLLVSGEKIALTNLDKVLWPADRRAKQPAFTKRDLILYLARVAPYMLPHLRDRPLTMIRMPDGILGERFFQKHWGQPIPRFVETITIFSESKSESTRYLLCNNLATLIWLGQIGTLEFHVWHSRADPEPDAPGSSNDFAGSLAALERSILNYPDYVVFDLDPYIYSGAEAKGGEPELNLPAFEKGREVAFWLKTLLDHLGLPALVKTSGKTGLHVFVPIARTVDFDAARSVSETIGRHLTKQHPGDITMEWTVSKRTGKIFLDHNMNARAKTLNVAYSPRGMAGAAVSMPLTWKELEKAHPLDFRIDNVFDRLAKKGDVWRDAIAMKRNLDGMFG